MVSTFKWCCFQLSEELDGIVDRDVVYLQISSLLFSPIDIHFYSSFKYKESVIYKVF